MTDGTGPASILSSGEQAVAAHLRADPDATPAEIAAACDVPEDTVVKTISRIRDKTRRAVATLVESPYTEAVAADLEPDERRALIERLEPATER